MEHVTTVWDYIEIDAVETEGIFDIFWMADLHEIILFNITEIANCTVIIKILNH